MKIDAPRQRVSLVRRYRFSSAHRYFRPEWSEARNRETFGPCANEPAHGHNYRLWVAISGEIDPTTGFAVNLVALDQLVRERVLDVVDHRSLNGAIERFREGSPSMQIPTSESLVCWIREELEAGLAHGPGRRLEWIRVMEDEDLGAEWIRPSTDAPQGH
jgi:6-pyruvoyltetrahydropterin/6-carboxytetrahydropterin synthase